MQSLYHYQTLGDGQYVNHFSIDYFAFRGQSYKANFT